MKLLWSFVWILFGALSLSAQVPVPMNLTATVTGTSVALSWTSPDSGRRVSFLVSRKTGSSGAWSQIATTGSQAYTDSNLQPATYFYRVREKNRNSYSDYSSVVSAVIGPPPPPGGITQVLTLSTNFIVAGQTLTGVATLTNTGTTGIPLNQVVITVRPPGGTNSGGPYDDFAPRLGITTIAANTSVSLTASRAFNLADPSGAWWAYVTYQDGSGVWHDGSNVNFTVSASSGPAPVALSWDAETVPIAGYNIYRSEQSGVYGLRLSGIQPATLFSDTTVLAGHTYFYVVTAVATDGVTESTHSNEVSASR